MRREDLVVFFKEKRASRRSKRGLGFIQPKNEK